MGSIMKEEAVKNLWGLFSRKRVFIVGSLHHDLTDFFSDAYLKANRSTTTLSQLLGRVCVRRFSKTVRCSGTRNDATHAQHRCGAQGWSAHHVEPKALLARAAQWTRTVGR